MNAAENAIVLQALRDAKREGADALIPPEDRPVLAEMLAVITSDDRRYWTEPVLAAAERLLARLRADDE